MFFELVVVAVLYLPGLSNGEFVWSAQDVTYHHMYFESLKACEDYGDRRADDIGRYLTTRQFDFWGDVLDLKRDEIRLDYTFGCIEGQS